MSLLSITALVAAGIGAGLLSTIAGLASLVSYPALLAFGLPPVTANVTNTAGLTASAIGSLAATRPELRGTWRKLWPRIAVFAVFGSVGGWLLLSGPPGSFERVVPWLIGGASLLLLFRDEIQRYAATKGRAIPHSGPVFFVVLALVATYGGYFGAAAGVILLAWLMLSSTDSLAYNNAEKNVMLGASNLSATLFFLTFGEPHWGAALCIAVGGIIGSFIGPKLLRRLPERPVRIAIAIAGIVLAIKLFLDTL